MLWQGWGGCDIWRFLLSGGTSRKGDFERPPQRNLLFSTLKPYPMGEKMERKTEGGEKGGEKKEKKRKERRKRGGRGECFNVFLQSKFPDQEKWCHAKVY